MLKFYPANIQPVQIPLELNEAERKAHIAKESLRVAAQTAEVEIRRLYQIAEHFDVDVQSSPSRWMIVALKIAQEYWPGFSVGQQPRRGRPPKRDRLALVAQIELIKAHTGQNISQAAKTLAAQGSIMGTMLSADSIETNYHDYRRQIDAMPAARALIDFIASLPASDPRTQKHLLESELPKLEDSVMGTTK